MKPLHFCAALTLLFASLPAADGGKTAMPDFTRGDTLPANAKHDWNLGPTGLRGWIYCDKLVTTDARQISVTQVAKGSPAEKDFQIGDVILGVSGTAFSSDPRTEFGRALTAAETEAGGGNLRITRWRAGKTGEVVLRLPVLGGYSATAPYSCPKSKRILEQGCKALAERMERTTPTGDPIVRCLNALALLAGGDQAYLPLVRREAVWASEFTATSMQTWHYGYLMMFLSEYIMATGDKSVLPGLRRLALEAARGQSAVGSWGHGFAIPDGRLGGYGMMNSPGIPLTIGLHLSRGAGVTDPEVGQAVELSARLLRFYIGKGAIPYGDHVPWIENHDDNGKCGMAAVLFDLLGEKNGAEFFSRMSVASHGAERDTGHTGNFFNLTWAMPGVARSGPNATGGWMAEYGAWYFDLARRWDGAFPHQGPPEPGNDSYGNWDASGAYLLAYAMPLKKILLTGRRPSIAPQLDPATVQELLRDGRGWTNKDRNSAYDSLGEEQLQQRLASWSPVVRERAAMALARRKQVSVPSLAKLLSAPPLETRYGACQALAALRGRAAPALPELLRLLQEKDLWLRIQAAEALCAIGKPAAKAAPELLEMLARGESSSDPRAMEQRYLCFALFDGNGLLSHSLEGVDREALYKAVRAGLRNQDGRARGSLGSVYQKLTLQEISPLLPDILKAVVEPAPSGEMFADEIRVEGLRVMAKHNIEEGLRACVDYARNQNPWASQNRTPELMKILLSYGTHAKALVPDLQKLATYFEKEEKNFPKNLMIMKANCVRDTIKAIEASTGTPALQRIK